MRVFDPHAPTEHESVLNDVLQLTDIPGVIVLHQNCQNPVGDSRDVFALQAIELRDEVLDEERDVIAPIAEPG